MTEYEISEGLKDLKLGTSILERALKTMSDYTCSEGYNSNISIDKMKLAFDNCDEIINKLQLLHARVTNHKSMKIISKLEKHILPPNEDGTDIIDTTGEWACEK